MKKALVWEALIPLIVIGLTLIIPEPAVAGCKCVDLDPYTGTCHGFECKKGCEGPIHTCDSYSSYEECSTCSDGTEEDYSGGETFKTTCYNGWCSTVCITCGGAGGSSGSSGGSSGTGGSGSCFIRTNHPAIVGSVFCDLNGDGRRNRKERPEGSFVGRGSQYQEPALAGVKVTAEKVGGGSHTAVTDEEGIYMIGQNRNVLAASVTGRPRPTPRPQESSLLEPGAYVISINPGDKQGWKAVGGDGGVCNIESITTCTTPTGCSKQTRNLSAYTYNTCVSSGSRDVDGAIFGLGVGGTITPTPTPTTTLTPTLSPTPTVVTPTPTYAPPSTLQVYTCPYVQTYDADVHAQGGIDLPAPVGGYLLDRDIGVEGIVSSKDETYDYLSQTEWSAKTDFTLFAKDYIPYQLIKNKINTEGKVWGGEPDGYYIVSGTIDGLVLNPGDTLVLLAGDNTINITGDITIIGEESFFLLAVNNGHITIDPSVGELHGIYYTQGGTISTGTNIDPDNPAASWVDDGPLTVRGQFIGNEIDFERNLRRTNDDYPAEVFYYKPSLSLNAPPELMVRYSVWEEITP